MTTTHPNFKSFEENIICGDTFFILGGPAFLNSCFLKRYNFTREKIWDNLPIFPQHFDRIYSLTYAAKKSVYSFHVIGHLEVNKKVCYIDFSFYMNQRTNTYVGRIFFWDKHWTFVNSLPYKSAEKILPLLKRDGIKVEICTDLDFSLVKKNAPTLFHIVLDSLYKSKFVLAKQTDVLPSRIKTYFEAFTIVKTSKELYSNLCSASPSICVNQSSSALNSRAGSLWRPHMFLILFMYYIF